MQADDLKVPETIIEKTVEKKDQESKPQEVIKPTPPEAKPIVTQPEPEKKEIEKPRQKAETKPVETKPVEAKPVETKPVETKPVETKIAETKPVETKPVEKKPEIEKKIEVSVTIDAPRRARIYNRKEVIEVLELYKDAALPDPKLEELKKRETMQGDVQSFTKRPGPNNDRNKKYPPYGGGGFSEKNKPIVKQPTMEPGPVPGQSSYMVNIKKLQDIHSLSQIGFCGHICCRCGYLAYYPQYCAKCNLLYCGNCAKERCQGRNK